jgi:hypothetical protein
VSKFIDRLKQLSEGTPQPIGFRLGAKAPARLRIQLIALLTGEKISIPQNSLAEADAVIVAVTDNISTDTLSTVNQSNNGKPVGIQFPSRISDGMDFIVFSTELPISAIPDKKAGKILKINAEISDGMMRAVNALPVDAVIMVYQSQNDNATFQDLLNIKRFTGVINKPFLLTVSAGIDTGDLQAFWEAGVDGIVVDITGNPGETLKNLRKNIEKLEFPDEKRKERLTPSVPRPAPQLQEHEDEEEEEEEE